MKIRASLKYFVSYCILGAQTCTPASESLWIRHCNILSSRSSHQTCSMIKGVARGDEGEGTIPSPRLAFPLAGLSTPAAGNG